MKTLIMSFLLCSITFAFAVNLSVELPEVYENNSELILRVDEGFNDIEKAILYFRADDEESYISLDMQKGLVSEPIYTVSIPSNYSFDSAVELYFEALTENGQKITYPQINPQLNPLRLIVANSDTISESIILLSPDVNFPINAEELIIAFSYFSIQNDIKANSIKIFFDGKDYSSKAKITKNMAILKLPTPKAGKHTFKMKAESVMGNKISSKDFSFDQNKSAKIIPFNIDGSLSAYGKYESNSETDNYNDANMRLILNVRKNWFRLKSKTFLTSLEDSKKQPLNRFSLDIDVPHFGVKIGDFSPNFGSFAINSVNVRGVFSELNFKLFRLQALYGDSKRAIPGKLYTTNNSETVNGDLYVNNDIAFARETTGIKMEFGHERYFNYGLSFVKNKDRVSSLDEEQYFAPDSTLLVRPKDNIVIATDTRFAFKDQRIVFGAEAAMSLYNSNIIDGAISQDSLETLVGQEIPIDPEDLEGFFVVNSNIEPFEPGLSNLSYKAYMRVFLLRNLFNISYSYVGSSFNNLSVGYLAKDLATISISDNIALFNNRFLLNISYNMNNNNLSDDKEFTTNNNTFYAQVYVRPTNDSFFNFSYNINNTDNSSDTFETRTSVYSIGMGYNVKQIDYAPTKFSVNFSNSVNEDLLGNTYDFQKNVITISANSKYRDFPLKSKIGYSVALDENKRVSFDDSYCEIEELDDSSYHSVFVNTSYLFNEKIEPIAKFRFSVSSGDFEYSSQNVNIGTKYKFDRKTDLYAGLGFANYNYPNLDENDNSELELSINLKRRF